MILQRYSAILSYISGSKNADLEAFAVPLANNMEAKHCTGQTILDYQRKESGGLI